MGKQRKGGLPYLKTSLSFTWSLSVSPEQETVFSDVLNYLESCGCGSEEPEPSASNRYSCFVNDAAGFALQNCFDLVKTESIGIVFLDSSLSRPSAVGNALGMYFNNFSSSKTYCMPGLEERLLASLNRRANALFLRKCPSELDERIKLTFNPVVVEKRKGGSYSPVSLIKSQGKGVKNKT
ncbi:unnamed protein product [Cylicocyclus nassatus]|uniref:Uncharacterized protein n=1 Tax=Cylicocyclus nassatus TaxID=53992 RepID=A0AA36GZC1_CYLNA|nr:unnamed protein product [Cylicocyclus nassatus]